jgi:hypothetical protein
MAEYTPGPWTLGADRSGFVLYEKRNGGNDHVAHIKTQDKAVARLVAAAPDLLEALEIAAEALCDLPLMDPRTVAIRAAIAKATGAL